MSRAGLRSRAGLDLRRLPTRSASAEDTDGSCMLPLPAAETAGMPFSKGLTNAAAAAACFNRLTGSSEFTLPTPLPLEVTGGICVLALVLQMMNYDRFIN